MNQSDYEKIKSMLAFLKRSGVLDRRPEKSIRSKLEILYSVSRQKETLNNITKEVA